MGVTSDSLFYLLIYLPGYFLFSLVQKIYWMCNGMNDIVTQIKAGQLYERSAQVFDIQYRIKMEPFQLLGRTNFLATHRTFEHPNYVLGYNVSLLVVQLDMAIFVEVPHDYDIFDCTKSPFIHTGQFEKAIRIITMPIASFIRCAEELGDPKSKVVWLHSTGRCGSTALSQVFEAVPNCTTVSEPMCLMVTRNLAVHENSAKGQREWRSGDAYTKLLVATTRMMAKPNEHNPEVFFIKNCTQSGVVEVADIEKYFPNHINLFLYRDCLDTVQSYSKSLNHHFLLWIIMKTRNNACLRYICRTPQILLRILSAPEHIDTIPWLSDPVLQRGITGFGLLVVQWGIFCHHYSYLVNECKSSVRAIRYEDIVDHKHATLTMLFKFCGISLDHLEAAKKRLETDSQAGTVLSKANLGRFKKVHVTERLQEEANLYLKAFNLSPLGQPTYLPQVLSPSFSNSAGSACDISDGLCNGVFSNGHIAITIPS